MKTTDELVARMVSMTSDINTSTLGVRTKLRNGQHGNEIKAVLLGSGRKKFEPGGEECNDTTWSGCSTSVTYLHAGRMGASERSSTS